MGKSIPPEQIGEAVRMFVGLCILTAAYWYGGHLAFKERAQRKAAEKKQREENVK